MKNFIIVSLVFITCILFFTSPIEARSGCCSHHQGVCGCRCCDGTPLSAKCAPYYPECSGGGSVQQPVYAAPTTTPYIRQPTATSIPPTRTNIPSLTPTPIPTKSNVLGAETKNPTPSAAVQSSTNSDTGTELLGLLILGGIGYWLYKRRKSAQPPTQTPQE